MESRHLKLFEVNTIRLSDRISGVDFTYKLSEDKKIKTVGIMFQFKDDSPFEYTVCGEHCYPFIKGILKMRDHCKKMLYENIRIHKNYEALVPIGKGILADLFSINLLFIPSGLPILDMYIDLRDTIGTVRYCVLMTSIVEIETFLDRFFVCCDAVEELCRRIENDTPDSADFEN